MLTLNWIGKEKIVNHDDKDEGCIIRFISKFDSEHFRDIMSEKSDI